MTYKITSTRQVAETLFTTVEYNFNGNIVIVEVAHFMASSTEEIETNISNRAQSELNRIQAEAVITNLVPTININEEKNL
jgi:hypothetical protein